MPDKVGSTLVKSENGSTTPVKVGYEKIMGFASSGDDTQTAVSALSNRLTTFRKWLVDDAKVDVSSAVCIVNGEASDGTKNAPVLIIDKRKLAANGATGNDANNGKPKNVERRLGVVDSDADQTLYESTMGCQVRVTRSVEKDDILMTMRRGAFITPDLVAASDAGKAVLACCQGIDGKSAFWDAFENTTICESKYSNKVIRNSGPQLLVKILQERKKVETSSMKRAQERAQSLGANGKAHMKYTLAEQSTISTRAPLMAFIIQQRFSDEVNPSVQSGFAAVKDQFDFVKKADDGNAFKTAKPVARPPGSPDTFAPYARTLPSSIGVPLCWKRSELALLSSSIPGLSLLQEVAGRTLQLAAEYLALLDAGILERFPETFPEGLLTWERWVWAAVTLSARFLPATTYIDKKTTIDTFRPLNPLEYQSPPEIWQELGVLVPLMDMFNHEVEGNQVTWEPQLCCDDAVTTEVDRDKADHPPRLVAHSKVRKGSELYTCYGLNTNHELIMQYGFAQLNNASDEVKVGWGMADAVGHLDVPTDFTLPVDDEGVRRFCVFETTDDEACKKWWTDDRIKLLKKEVFSEHEEGFMDSLKNGKKMTSIAFCDGNYHPILLSAIVIATMPKIDLQRQITDNGKERLKLTKRHQHVLQCYLVYFFTKKLEKLLENISAGLKVHFGTDKLWTRGSKGGLRYHDANDDTFVGWQGFLDSHVYKSTIEVENHYYAMGFDSCVLALLDGQLRALQSSIDGATDHEKFKGDVLKQVQNLGFDIADDNVTGSGNEKKSPRGRKRIRGSGKPQASSGSSGGEPKHMALKLHVGNLAFSTTPADMYDYFSKEYGKDNVLECHIPVERDTGRSRGFGFVTVPASLADRILDVGKKHELDGRLVKVARSNSAGSNDQNRSRSASGPTTSSNDRCGKCGYRPKYCSCRPHGAAPSHWMERGSLPYDHPDFRRNAYDYPGDRLRDARYRDGPPPLPPIDVPPYYDDCDRQGRDFDRYGGGRSDDRPRVRGSGSDEGRHRDRDRSRSPRDRSGDSPRRREFDDYRGSRRDDDDRSDRRSSRRSRSRDRSRKRKKHH